MSEQTDVRMEDWNRLQREVARLRILVIDGTNKPAWRFDDTESAAKAQGH